ncbi:nuclear transport factor 2 family protein [Actinoplanes sp. NPDC049316]|uniref:nuclear transport factor 2 family protein n=1 Tax=Actinoplanes sp. NPDC049316 TaxID=3154727 RepID=UPI00343D7A17
MTETRIEELMCLEEQGWAALCRGEGRAFYEVMLADDAVVVVPGALLDKAQTLASWDGVPPWEWYDLVKRHVAHLGEAVVVVYDVTACRRLQTPYRATASSTYVPHPDGWRLMLHQQTPWA